MLFRSRLRGVERGESAGDGVGGGSQSVEGLKGYGVGWGEML